MNSAEVSKAAETLKDQGVRLYSVGVGDGADSQAQRNATSVPDNRYLTKADNYDRLNTLVPLLSMRIPNGALQ